jgi:hypothetical protein
MRSAAARRVLIAPQEAQPSRVNMEVAEFPDLLSRDNWCPCSAGGITLDEVNCRLYARRGDADSAAASVSFALLRGVIFAQGS